MNSTNIIQIHVYCPKCEEYVQVSYDISWGAENKVECPKCNKKYELEGDDHPEGGWYYWISKEIQ